MGSGARIRLLSKPQRIVIVIALGVACAAVGAYVASLGGTAAIGWYAYAPLTPANLPRSGLAGWLRLLIWLGLTSAWALVSIWVLRPSGEAAPVGYRGSPG